MKSKLIPVELSLQNPEHVFQLQEALNILIPSIINSDELNNRTFGTTTQAAIKSFQKNNSLKETGRVDSNLINEINAHLSDYNRVIGLITDINGACLNDVTIRIYLEENNNEIGTSHTYNDGSYCVYLNYILNNNRSKSGAVKIIIRLYQRDEEKYSQIAFLDSTLKVLRIDISSNKLSYNGLGLFSDIHNSVRYYSPDIYGLELANYKFDTLTEINNLSKLTGFSEEEIIKNLISNRIIIENENFSNLSPELFFAFLIQNYPVNLPKKLFPEIDQSAEGAADLLIAHFENLEEISRIGIILLYDVESINFNTIVENAKFKHLISSDFVIDSTMNEDLFSIYNNYIQNKPLLYGDETIISKIKSADLTHAIQLSTLFIENNGDVIAFKKAVRANGLVSVDLSKFELAGVTQNHAATIALIERDASISDLSGYTFNDLKNNIFTGLSSQYTLPEGFENVDSYASYIALNIQKLYPNESYFTHIEKLHKTGDPSNGLSINFDNLKNHIITNNIDILTTEVEDIEQEEYHDDYKIIQKVFRLSPTPATAGALINEKIHTAHQIYLTGKEKIKQKLSLRGIGSEEVEMLFSMATARYASALAAFSNINSNFNQLDPLAISTSRENLIGILDDKFPNISTLFGSTDYCDCQHCQSVYSPSAYLADVLTFLKSKRSELTDKSAEEVLTAPTRRQDIEKIKLNCQNTDTTMPYIDLACEILEENIAPQNPSIAKQTTLTAEELKAMPEHVNKEAYRTLRTASYPMNSSFNLWQEESRTYLAKMGIKRYELMEAFNGADLDITAEYFGLTTVEKEIIACTGTTYSNVGNRNSIWSPVTNNKMTVTVFLRDTGLNCNEFLELLGVKWLNITLKNTLNIVVTLANIGCSCEDLFIEYTPDIFDKTHRFIRLWRKSGYKMWELDLLLSSQNIFGLTSQDLDAQFLISFKKFDELKKQLNLSFEKMLALYNPINTETRKVNGKDESALYNRLFLNNNLKKIVNSDIQANTVLKGLDIFKVDSTTKNLPKDGTSYFLINDNTNNELNKFIKNVITVAFSISESDYVLLLDKLDNSTSNIDLKIENLSFIYRHVIIAKQLKLSIPDFIDLLKLLENDTLVINPFQSVNKTFEFVTLYNEIKNTGLNTDDLNYLTYFQYNSDFSTTPTDYPALAHPNSFYNETIEKLRSALCPYFDKYNTSDSTNDDMIKRLLIRFPLFLNDDNTVNTANITKVEQLITKTLPPNNPLTLTEIQNAVIETYLKPFVKDIAAAKLFFSKTPEPSEADKRNFILISLLKYFTVQYLGEQQIFNNQSIVDTAIALIENGSSNAEVEKNKIFIQTYFGSLNQNTDELKATLCSIPTTTDNVIDNYKMVFRFLYNYVVNCQIADIFSIKRNVSDLLLQKLSFKNESNTVANLYSYFSNGDLFAKETNGTYTKAISFTNFKDLYRSLILIHKSCMLVNKLKISEEDLQWLLINQNLLDYLPWKTNQTLSVDPITSQTLTGLTYNVSNLLKFKKLLNLKNKYGVKNDISLFNIVNRYIKTQSSEHTPLIEDLAKLIQKEYNELNKISNIFSFGINDSTTTLNLPATYEKIEKCFNYISLAGADAATIIEWVDRAESKEEAVAEKITSVLKSKYSYDQWLIELPPMQKGIREKKCHALSAYLIEHSQRTTSTPAVWYDTNDLYAYFLIDTEMSACQLTSRIKMAISSVQLFVQRCLLNLEPNVKTHRDPDWKQWKWMKNYRIWEANRKVFLYPENWIEPELRDDKTPFFIELENELNQNDITADYAEEVFGNYLQKLHEVSNLEIAGIYHEIETKNKINTLHVIGRTRSHPHIYYYRKYNGNTNVWSAWEKIDLDIKGELIVPIVYNRKLHIFWLVVNEKAKKETRDNPKNEKEPIKYYEIQLAWSIYKKKGWISSKLSKLKHLELGYQTNEFELQPIKNISLVSSYDDINNELCFNLGLHIMTKSYAGNGWNNASSFIIETANFKFDGNVYHVKSSFIDFKASVTDNNYTIQQSNPDPFNIVTKNMDEELVPERFFQIKSYWPRGIKLLANTIYFTNGVSFENIWKQSIILHDYTFNNNYRVLLYTLNTNPSLIMDLQKNVYNLFTNTINEWEHPFFYQDVKRVFLVNPMMKDDERKYIFTPFYHPYTKLFNRELERIGIEGLLNRNLQINPQNLFQSTLFDFNSEYDPQNGAELAATYQKTTNQNGVAVPLNEFVDFSFGSAFSVYNWELFFHAPLYIACKLSQNQKFEEAMQWFHYIFNPTNATNISTEQNGNDVPQKFWITKPFFEISKNEIKAENIGNILNNIDTYKDQVTAWLNDPFKPHLIARYRPVAYQRTVVMKYIDNLIAWGDQLFKRDTIESINEATMLYVLACEILGPKPRKHPNLKTYDNSYHDLTTTEYDIINTFDQNISFAFEQNNVKLQIANHNVSNRNEFNHNIINEQKESSALIHNHIQFRKTNLPLHISEEHELPRIDAENFCIPANDILLGYWDLVEDRLYKIRHCMNIKGIVRQLPLFEPPIDPALLVRAAAAGLDFGSVLDDLSVPHPHYRFRVILQKAIEFCSEVKQLGEKLLSAIEKKDAEGLTLLRSVQEMNVLNAVKQVRKLQIQEAIESAKGLEKTMLLTEEKKNYYESREFMNTLESASFGLSAASAVLETIASICHATAAATELLPDFTTGGAGMSSPVFLSTLPGGTKISKASKDVGLSLISISRNLDKYAGLVGIMANYKRRKEDWEFQAKMAGMEIEQINKQILAAEIRQQITEKELENQDLQIEQAKTSDEYYKSKFSNEQLYNWMISQISNIYFQSYQLAYEMAKKAEKCYRYELGINDNEQFINFGYWDSLKKGLMAGDLLMNDLHRLDAAYINQNEREFELTKHISLAQVFPDKLIDLITKGETFINLPEWLFNMDYPGHYMRRIKSISISIPNVAGPYTNVNCTLSLLKSEIRINSSLKSGEYTKIDNGDNRFIEKSGVTQSIATSHGQNDSGLFELNFNDERYLPFEGAGAISEWKISLPKDSNQFDFASISDMIIHINYTAREGGDLLGTKAKAALNNHFTDENSMMLLSLKHDFPTEWHNFIQSADKKMEFEIKDEHLPYFAKKLNINNIKAINITPIAKEFEEFTINPPSVTFDNKNINNPVKGIWKLTVSASNADMAILDDLLLIIEL